MRWLSREEGVLSVANGTGLERIDEESTFLAHASMSLAGLALAPRAGAQTMRGGTGGVGMTTGIMDPPVGAAPAHL